MLQKLAGLDWTAILLAVVAIDHLLASIPSVKASSLFQMISNTIEWVVKQFGPKDPAPPVAK